MRRVYWSLLIGLGVVVGGIIMGVGGLLLLPIIGVFALIALLIWFLERKAHHKPPLE